MIDSFISLVAKDILKIAGSDLRDLAIIFPNRRSGALFRQELIEQIESPVWSPGIFSIDDWLTGLSGLEKADRLVVLALLYEVVKSEVNDIGSFADFLDLGDMILADFDDVDKYLADPFKLFTTLSQIKKIDHQFDISTDEELVSRIRLFWNGFGSQVSGHQERWLELWEKLHPIYTAFNNRLISNGLGTSGMCYRKASERLVEGDISLGRYHRVAFVGFNILTKAEEVVFNYLNNSGIASFYWDFHTYYLGEPHEAGKFIQHYLNLFPPPVAFHPFPEGVRDFFHSTGQDETLTVVPVTSNSGQVQALLSDLMIRKPINRGIILSDEGLFSDLLTSWPDEVLPVNFTSGYPLRETQAAGFFNNLLNIYLDFNLTNEKQTCKTSIISAFLQHPWAKWLTEDSDNNLIELIQRSYPEQVPVEFVTREISLSAWIVTHRSPEMFLEHVSHAGKRLLSFESRYNQIEKAAISTVIAQSDKYVKLASTYNIGLDVRSLCTILSQFLNTFKITLETDRDANNQVIGVLETRLIDFEEVFILSCNEGIWPSKSLPGSLIPYSMRKILGLPTAENRDAMYAYYFYRLIQRAKSVNIYYLTGHRDDVIRSGEKSRYISQLKYSLPRKFELRLEPPARVGSSTAAIMIRKEGAVKDRLNQYLEGDKSSKSLSASAINEYLDCSLRFALKRIFDFKEPDEIAFASEPKGFGILIHQVMNRLYKEFLGADKGLESPWLIRVIEDRVRMDGIIQEEYSKVLKEPGVRVPGGKEVLAMEVVRQFLVKILEFDRINTPLKILGLEQEYRMEFPIRMKDTNCAVKMNGIIDRIDLVRDGIRIIDYKTGNIELSAKTIDEVFNREASKRPKEVFQILLYCELFAAQTAVTENLIPCLFRLSGFRAGEYDHRVKIASGEVVYQEIRDQFVQAFQVILEEIFDPEIPFTQTDDEQACRYCPFTGICSREIYS